MNNKTVKREDIAKTIVTFCTYTRSGNSFYQSTWNGPNPGISREYKTAQESRDKTAAYIMNELHLD